MKQITFRWVAVSVGGLIVLLCLALPPIPPAKARAARIQAVNQWAHPFPQSALVLSNVAVTNATVPVSTP